MAAEHTRLLALVMGLLLASDLYAADLDFNRDVQPILAANCLACHGFDAESREAGLRLDVAEAATSELDSGATAIVPGDPAASELISRIESDDADLVMPPPGSGHSLNAADKQILRDWIAAGAPFDQHWAFVAPVRGPLPSGEAAHPIDRFIGERLHAAGLDFAPQASAETLLRRVHLDLTGLPPTLTELDAFLAAWADDPDAAYEAAVDRLLASPHYGERLARWWLDMARYADSNGYSIDGPREIWAWRDWVIAALNDDMPFDQFTIEQLAGDLLPDATLSQKLATGFHRNTAINQEGGIDKEQFRIDSVFDRVATTGVVWLGLSIGCAQCHDHKFDPVSQRDYYQLFAFFNNQDEPNLALTAEALPFPETAPAEEKDKDGNIKPATTSLVLRERGEPRTTTVFVQGDFTRPADEVTPDTPAVLPALPRPDAEPAPATRLDLARWLVSPDNPLTSRVVVNRIWQRLFGRGLVETENDFGLMGTPPSHPELLDWLATEFMHRGWSLKDLHRLIVTSHTYRQASVETEALREADPANRLLSRQQRLRLDAEIVRDTGLTASGLLVPAVGGPPVFPPIPAGATALNQVKRDWKTSTGDNRYRRGLYTFLYRATPPPALSVFDAPPGITACTQRNRSNTPLQALALLNDEASVEMAKALAAIVESDGLEQAFRRCTARQPEPSELAVLTTLTPLEAARVLLNLDETITRE